MSIAICKNDNCAKKDNCKRYIIKDGEAMNFKNICNDENDFKWHWKEEQNIVVQEDTDESIPNDNSQGT